MIDPLINLVINVSANPNAYALILGSGISRSAGIPTGYEVMEDLIKKLAHLSKEEPTPTPFEWFKGKYKMALSYSKLLEKISATPAERNTVLKKYFEPDETSEGLKTPTPAHKAIARLVKKGFFKIIITTNFDRLLEIACQDENITPIVITNESASLGVQPFHSIDCLILKVNGDYLETTMKNTVEELNNYEPGIEKLLDRIIDEYGLLVCGWSGEWDHALRNAIQRCSTRRYTSFWTYRGTLKQQTTDLISIRKALPIEIIDSDNFFTNLEEKLISYSETQKESPVTKKIAIATVKRLIPDETKIIQLNDFVSNEAQKIFDELKKPEFSPTYTGEMKVQEYVNKTHRYEAISEVLANIFYTGCFWGNKNHFSLWKDTIEKISFQPFPRAGFNTILMQLRYYPALLAFYAGGIASIEGAKYETLSFLLKEINIHNHLNDEIMVLDILHPMRIFEKQWVESWPGMERRIFPGSDWVFSVLERYFAGDDSAKNKLMINFDKFEYYCALAYQQYSKHRYLLAGAYLYRKYGNNERGISEIIKAEKESKGEHWELFKSGLLNPSKIDEYMKNIDSTAKNYPAYF